MGAVRQGSPRAARGGLSAAGSETPLRLVQAALLLSCTPAGCAAVQSPSVDVLQARLLSAGLLDQQFQVWLCVSNLNPRKLTFSRVTFDVDVGGGRLASGVNDSPIILPPLGAVALPFSVAPTTRNLGAQLGSILSTGSVSYTVSGRIVFRDFSLVGIPYSVSRRVIPTDAAAGLISVAGDASVPADCGAAELARPTV